MKQITKKELNASIYEDGYVPWIKKGELFKMDGEIWRCNKSTTRHFGAERLKKKGSKEV